MVGVALEDKDGLNIGGGRHVDVVADDAGKTIPVSNAGGSRPVRTVEMRTAAGRGGGDARHAEVTTPVEGEGGKPSEGRRTVFARDGV
ncbi:hypothetical protein ZWY2020_038214 [Hordeum vulgare]|nr:hypothetical protein ZWY2020_038214 [Hordeum vulgare]